MKRAIYPFSAVVGQSEMKLALLLAAVDWRLSVLLRGEKGSAKTTTARGLAALMPEPAPFINLPIGATEDRLLGGLHLERALKGDAVLKPGLLSEAHGGVLYVDEINLLPAHLGDTLLDTASSGVNVIEREGLSASHAAEFVLLGSMNPEEGSLRPQLLDRFALCADVHPPLDPAERQIVVERRIAFERDALQFEEAWAEEQKTLAAQVSEARARLNSVVCPIETLGLISATVCEMGVRSLRADLAVMRASIVYAALMDDASVEQHHVTTVLPLVLAHRTRNGGRPQQATPPRPERSQYQTEPAMKEGAQQAMERIFAPKAIATPAVRISTVDTPVCGINETVVTGHRGPVIRSRPTDTPGELDLRATLSHAVAATGTVELRADDLHERVRKPRRGTRYLFLIDSSGSHAARERMRLVKGAVEGLLARSFKKDDEVAIIVFRGTEAQPILEPTSALHDAIMVLEYLPTGGRTPLVHALELARGYLTPSTVLILLTDGHANVALNGGDPWEEAVEVAVQLRCSALVVDTDGVSGSLGQSRKLAEALNAQYIALEDLQDSDALEIAVQQIPGNSC
jgi:magnesium chelatase subunit D